MAVNIYDMTDTWDDAGTTYNAIKMDVTDTASTSTSNLLWLGVGGAQKFRVSKDASIVTSGDNISTTGARLEVKCANLPIANLSVAPQSISLISGARFAWSSSPTAPESSLDLFLARDAADTLALRNSTNAQTFNIYASYTDASNYTRGAVKAAAGLVNLEGESAGTGDANIDVQLTPKGTGRVRFGSHSAIAAETVTGYITVKDAGGTERKLAVVS